MGAQSSSHASGRIVVRPSLPYGRFFTTRVPRAIAWRRSPPFPDVTGLVRPELDEVNRLVEQALAPDAPELQALLGHVGGYRGKQLRPAMVLLVAKALDGLVPTHYSVAAIVEMIHTATLVHDDILDGALVRRKLASLNAINGTEVSVLVGDYIYAQAFRMSVGLRDQRCSQRLSDVTRIVCQGEITQMLHRFDQELSEERYLRVIGEKTAILYGASSELGAVYAEAEPALVERFERFGYELGLAFQIIDDCLDVEGDEKVVGKSLGTDFGKGKLTLPFLEMLRQLDAKGRERFREIFTDESIEKRQEALLASSTCSPASTTRTRKPMLSSARRCPVSRGCRAIRTSKACA
jgi:octaprenyl-diphosphate synthase